MLEIADQIEMRKKLYCHKIHLIASAILLVMPLPGSQETTLISKCQPGRNQRQAALAAWDQCESSPPRRSPKTGGPAHSGRRHAQPFLPVISNIHPFYIKMVLCSE